MKKKENIEMANAGLHNLYVQWAMQHLQIIEKCLELLDRGNINWLETYRSLTDARTKLIKTDPAYQEAAWRLLAGQEPSDDTPEVLK